jgi:acyl-CoA thioester hydrolase
MAESHRLAVRVYYEDTDASGVVYHANYLRFLERGRTEWLRALGLGHANLLNARDPLAFAVRKMGIAFERPARIDDLVAVETRLKQSSGARLILEQRIFRDEQLLVEAEVEVVCMSALGRPRRLPNPLQAALARRNS